MVENTSSNSSEGRMPQEIQDIIQKAWDGDTRPFVETFFRVQSKTPDEETGEIVVPFVLKPAQDEYWRNRTKDDIILKAAQMGFTTVCQADFLADAMFTPGLEVILVAQRDATGKRLFETTQRFVDMLPEALRPRIKSDSAHVIQFDFGQGRISTIEIGTASSKSFGRGKPIHRALFTEVGFYERAEENLMAGILARMPEGESRVVKESTANGQSGYFYEQWNLAKAGKSNSRPHFFPWWLEPGYRINTKLLTPLTTTESWLRETYALDDEQIAWRRKKLRDFTEEFFQQEYPESPEQAFIATGGSVFSRDETNAVKLSTRAPEVTRMNGLYQQWAGPLPGRKYIMAVDQSSGEQTDEDKGRPIDYQIATVYDSTDLSQVALIRGKISQPVLAEYIAKAWKYYGNPLVVVERNLAQWGFFDLLYNAGINNLYVHPSDKKPGFPVNTATKPLLIENFAQIAGTPGACSPRSANLSDEMYTFQWKKKRGQGQTGAAPGCHDDELMATFMAFWPEARTQAMLSWSVRGSDGRAPSTSRSVTISV